ncbi:phospholipase D zeta 1-like [Cynara cardunculus var. scolymus]|uniref:phospholipase D zeta 1-like n=1 Tax=Cynara cardunculus var. scolymus TaxID=59895 RepID=UPI000D624D0C|nr:phospholipase D zeta 1-like [Cynara cardunculus var. scolymus]
MSTERLISKGSLQSHHGSLSRHSSLYCPEPIRIFDELPKATILSVSRADVSDIGPLLLSYTIQLEYKQFKWCLLKKASQLIYLHFALKKRAIVEEIYEKQEQVKDWLQHIGIGDQTAIVHDNDEPDDGAIPVHNEDSTKKRSVPTRAALAIIRPSIRRTTVLERAKVAMQNYLNHFLGNIDIVNSREVCQFLEVSKLSFSPEYGPKLKEGYILVQHLSHIQSNDADAGCFMCCCCRNNWQKVWAVLKPGFLALLEDSFSTKLLDIIVFDALPPSNGEKEDQVLLAEEVKERNPLRYAFKVTCGNRSTKIRSTSKAKVRNWITAINNTGQKPIEGWCNSHRFGSFAPQRGLTDDGSQAQWFVDGQVAFEAIALSIANAKSEIYVTGWWLCPELYLRRPFHANGPSRLDALFEAKAKEGVKIYILMYKEVAIALKINSLYSQKRLLNIHENVKVLRYPDHFAAGIYLWSHHEKIVVVDHQICFLGGLDLCFGRYDTIEHKVSDCPPFIWPGKDYYNPRESEPNSWVDTMTDELDRRKYPRMPWHDVHCALWGPPCRDVARHFVQRWNHAKRNKAPNEQTIPLLMPQQHMVLPHYMGRSQKLDIESKPTDGNQIDIMQGSSSYESPSQDIHFLLPQEADVIDSSNANNTLNGLDQRNQLDLSHDEHLNHAVQTVDSADDFDSMDRQHENSTGSTSFGSEISDEGCEKQEVSSGDISQVSPRTSCSCQVIRSVCHWSGGTSQTEDSIHKAYCSLIEKAEKFVYIENQFFISGLSDDDVIQNRVLEALYRRILRAHKEEKCFRVIVVIPLLPGFQGGLDDGGAATVRAIMHWQYRTICRGQNSILHNLNSLLGPKTDEYISFYGLRTYGRLGDDGPIVTSQVYVHSKVMIVDDRITLIGSSNINDRSLLGHRDSEIGILIKDREFTESTMNGEPWNAGKFANSLRLSLWSEHLGLHGDEIREIRDPIADKTYKDLWSATARANSQIYQDVFSCIPNDSIHSRYAFRQSMNFWKEKLGHTTIDLGVAPEKLESLTSMEILKQVRGFLVSFPLQFMCQEDLRPMFSESEFYASPQVFY